jgi:hypothetical protein
VSRGRGGRSEPLAECFYPGHVQLSRTLQLNELVGGYDIARVQSSVRNMPPVIAVMKSDRQSLLPKLG